MESERPDATPSKDTTTSLQSQNMDNLEEQDQRDDLSVSQTITYTHHGTEHTAHLDASATLDDLVTLITTTLSIEPSHIKFMATPKPGLIKPSSLSPSPLLSNFLSQTKKMQLLAPLQSDLQSLSQNQPRLANRFNRPSAPPVSMSRATPSVATLSSLTSYTFSSIAPLQYLPDPPASLALLKRLAADKGIVSAMTHWKFRVGLLTEMDPAMHTTHESKTLGLNRNAGEVIELRLRTDANDGYRDYRTIRRTLCHELAHNVYGEHDSKFWALYREIEAWVEKNDSDKGGRTVGGERYFEGWAPRRGDGGGEDVDGGGWKGGDYVLGGVGVSSSATGLSRRDVIAKAAEERRKKDGGESAEPKA